MALPPMAASAPGARRLSHPSVGRARGRARDNFRRARTRHSSALLRARRCVARNARSQLVRRRAWLARDRMTSGAPNACAKSCADRPMRRSGGSRPRCAAHGSRLSQGSLARLGWPGAFIEPAQHDAIDVLQTRFQRTEDAHAVRRQFRGRRTDAALRWLRVKELGIIASADREAAGGRTEDKVFKSL